MKTIHNFRDFGGYHTENGAYVKNGLLYRSGALSHASEKDLEFKSRYLEQAISAIPDAFILYDANGSLDKAAINLNNKMYYPTINEDFKIDKITMEVGEVLIHAEVVRHLSNKFTLNIN